MSKLDDSTDIEVFCWALDFMAIPFVERKSSNGSTYIYMGVEEGSMAEYLFSLDLDDPVDDPVDEGICFEFETETGILLSYPQP